MKNQSEIKFVEWAEAISASDYDVKAVVEALSALKREKLFGLDVGGGIGRFAAEITKQIPGTKIVVVDNSSLIAGSFVSDENCILETGDWFSYQSNERYDFLIFKTVLHHFIAPDEAKTEEAQLEGLRKAFDHLKDDGLLLVEENFYESAGGLGDLTGRIIFEITRMKWIAKITRKLGANTAGEGVRFRSFETWASMFSAAGFEIQQVWEMKWDWQLWQRIPLLGARRFQAVVSMRKRGYSM